MRGAVVAVLAVAGLAACSAPTAAPEPRAERAAAPVTASTAQGRTGCAERPSACGYPDATTTGIEAGHQLREVDGPLVVDRDGATIEDLDVHGSIDVAADDVTLRNVRVDATGEGWGIGLRGAHGTTIEHCEVAPDGPRLLVGIKDAYGDATGTTIRACDIARTTTGIQVHEGLVADNYVHALAYRDGDHLNGITSNGATTPLVIRHNTILNPVGQTDAIGLFQDFGREARRTITDNLLAGGGYTVYGGEGGHGAASDIVVSDNRFARTYFRHGGRFGPVAYFDPTGPGNVWSGNRWDDTLQEVPAP
jgi:hypothetical protein